MNIKLVKKANVPKPEKIEIKNKKTVVLSNGEKAHFATIKLNKPPSLGVYKKGIVEMKKTKYISLTKKWSLEITK